MEHRLVSFYRYMVSHGIHVIGAYQTGGAEAQHMYVGLFRKYWTPLTAQEVSDNYDADKSKYGLT